MGDSRSYELTLSIRAITSKDGMTAEVFYFKEDFIQNLAGKIIGQVKGINRVLYDITSSLQQLLSGSKVMKKFISKFKYQFV